MVIIEIERLRSLGDSCDRRLLDLLSRGLIGIDREIELGLSFAWRLLGKLRDNDYWGRFLNDLIRGHIEVFEVLADNLKHLDFNGGEIGEIAWTGLITVNFEVGFKGLDGGVLSLGGLRLNLLLGDLLIVSLYFHLLFLFLVCLNWIWYLCGRTDRKSVV